MKLKTLLTENKQVGILYHFRTRDGFVKLINNDFVLQTQKHTSISLTRDFNFGSIFALGKIYCVRLTLDGNKLSDKYKIEPYNYFYYANKLKKDRDIISPSDEIKPEHEKYFSRKDATESEERIRSNKVDVSNCILEIQINKKLFFKDITSYELTESKMSKEEIEKLTREFLTKNKKKKEPSEIDKKEKIFSDYINKIKLLTSNKYIITIVDDFKPFKL
jgi:hypothetical protein